MPSLTLLALLALSRERATVLRPPVAAAALWARSRAQSETTRATRWRALSSRSCATARKRSSSRPARPRTAVSQPKSLPVATASSHRRGLQRRALHRRRDSSFRSSLSIVSIWSPSGVAGLRPNAALIATMRNGVCAPRRAAAPSSRFRKARTRRLTKRCRRCCDAGVDEDRCFADDDYTLEAAVDNAARLRARRSARMQGVIETYAATSGKPFAPAYTGINFAIAKPAQ